jgi:hypothetical protein
LVLLKRGELTSIDEVVRGKTKMPANYTKLEKRLWEAADERAGQL